MTSLYIHGVGHFHPENVIDNQFLEELDIGTNEAWVLERVGIRERRTVLPLDYLRATHNADVREGQSVALYSNAETGRRAGQAALERAGLVPSDIGMVIAGGCSPERMIPAEAATIARELGIEGIAFDVNSACSSFGAQIHLLHKMAASGGLPKFVLIVNPENNTRVVNYADRATAVLWGDGTCATVVSATEKAPLEVKYTTLESSPAGCDAVVIPRFSHFHQDGGAVQRFAIRTSKSCIEPLLPKARAHVARTGGTIRYIGHQANLLMLESVARRAGLEPEQHWHNIEAYGNTAAAGAPTVLSQNFDNLRAGDAVMLVVVGSGLTWASMYMEMGA